MREMKIVQVIIFYLCFTLFMAALVEAKGWRDIMPARSTRADVERLLGPPADSSNEYISVYHLENEVVIFHYEGNRPCKSPGGWQVPRGTVVSITVTPKTKLRLSDLQVDESRYKKTNGGHRSEDVIYTDNERGESITVYQGDVTRINYFPAASDNYLRCPDASNASNDGRDNTIYYPLDTYHDVTFEAEKSALDNFAINLLEDPKMKGYIIAYAGRRARAGEARARAECAKNYLVNERGIEAGRIVTMDGGHREEFTVDLYLVPRGAAGPTATPTVDPKEVQSIKAGSARNNRRSTRPRCKR
jgi:hypothetical protein